MKKPLKVVWFSCGAASAVAAKKTIERDSDNYQILVVNNPVANEHSDNLRFLKDVEKWIGQEIISATNPNYPSCNIVDVFEKRKYISGIKGAPCTQQLKKEARYIFEKSHDIHTHVLGFTVDEKARHERFTKFERSNVDPVLIDLKLTKQDCFEILLDAGIKLPEIYNLGFPNANCIGCDTYTNKLEDNNSKGIDLCTECNNSFEDKTGWCSINCCITGNCDQTC